MKLAALVLVALCAPGCGGYVVVEDRNPPPPRHAPARERARREVGRQQAIDIAIGAASERDCRHIEVQRVERQGRSWDVVMSGRAHHGGHSRIVVRVDRATGAVLSYKSKGDDRHHHERDDDDDHDHDGDHDHGARHDH